MAYISDRSLSTLSTNSALGGCLRSRPAMDKWGQEMWAADPGEMCMRSYLCEDVHSASTCAVLPRPAPSHCQWWRNPSMSKGWVRVQRLPWELALWAICSHWQIYFVYACVIRVLGEIPSQNVLWHVLVSVVLGNDADFFFLECWDCKYEHVLCLNYPWVKRFSHKTLDLLAHFKLKI